MKVGDGLEPDCQPWGRWPMNGASRHAELTEDAVKHGGKLWWVASGIGNRGNFFAPTILLENDRSAKNSDR